MPDQIENKINSYALFESILLKQKNFFALGSLNKKFCNKKLENSFKIFAFEKMKNSKLYLNCIFFLLTILFVSFSELNADKVPFLSLIQIPLILIAFAALAASYLSLQNFRVNKFFHEAFSYLITIYNIFHLISINIFLSEKENNSKITASYYFILMTCFNLYNTYEISFLRFFWNVIVNFAILVFVTLSRLNSDVRGIEDLIAFVIVISVIFVLKEQNDFLERRSFFGSLIENF